MVVEILFEFIFTEDSEGGWQTSQEENMPA